METTTKLPTAREVMDWGRPIARIGTGHKYKPTKTKAQRTAIHWA